MDAVLFSATIDAMNTKAILHSIADRRRNIRRFRLPGWFLINSKFHFVRGHHREVHHCGDEAAWWIKTGINPTVSARALWLQTHPLLTSSAAVAAALTLGGRAEFRIASARRPMGFVENDSVAQSQLEVPK
jgi:hypothetical protein